MILPAMLYVYKKYVSPDRKDFRARLKLLKFLNR